MGLEENPTDGLFLRFVSTPLKFNELLIAFLIHNEATGIRAVMQTDYLIDNRQTAFLFNVTFSTLEYKLEKIIISSFHFSLHQFDIYCQMYSNILIANQ